jgi:hypothetical protein
MSVKNEKRILQLLSFVKSEEERTVERRSLERFLPIFFTINPI